MARTSAGNRLSIEHRAQQLAIRSASLQDLLTLWRAVNPTNLTRTIGPFASAAAVLVRARFLASAQAAVEYYQALRRVEGVSGSVTIVPPDPPPREEASNLLRGAALSGVINGRRRGFSVEAAARNGFVKASGSMSGLVLGGGRQVVLNAAASDPKSTGRWARVAGGGACDFCKMLEGRGAVFSARSVDFAAHDHCACNAEPVFR